MYGNGRDGRARWDGGYWRGREIGGGVGEWEEWDGELGYNWIWVG